MSKDVIIITGPTASGKSSIAKLIKEEFEGNIISCDSQQIYKEMNIGTNKEQDFFQYMVDEISPLDNYSVEDYKKKARLLINELKNPIIVGGTGFYIDSILYNLNYAKSIKNENIRQKYNNLVLNYGNKFIYDLLYEVDKSSAQKYHPNEVNRIIRNLEIYETTGKKPSEIKEGLKKLNYEINPHIYLLNYNNREKLYNIINSRVDKMIEIGLIEEVKSLVIKYNLSKNNQSMQAIGYKETLEYLSGNLTIDELLYKIKLNTRHYAKRQLTWMKKYREFINTKEIYIDNYNSIKEVADCIICDLKEKKFGE